MHWVHDIGIDDTTAVFVGDDMTRTWLGKNLDGTAWSWVGRTVIAEICGSVEVPTIVLDSGDGSLKMSLTAAQTSAIGVGFHRYFIRVTETATSETETMLSGTLRIRKAC